MNGSSNEGLEPVFSMADLLYRPAAQRQPQNHAHRGRNGGFVGALSQRDTEEQTVLSIEQLALKPREIVTEIGAGTGYFNLRLARRLRAS